MSALSLREVEKALSALWSNSNRLEQFLDGDESGIDPAIAKAIDKERLKLYGHILKHGRLDAMQSIYPLCSKLLGRNWPDIVADYIDMAPSDDYRINNIGRMFPRYVRENLLSKYKKRLPYLAELADYEWTEMDVLDIDDQPISSDECLLQTQEEFREFRPIVNPALAIKQYEYPIIKIAADLEATPNQGAESSSGEHVADGEGTKSKSRKRVNRYWSKDPTNAVIYLDPEVAHCRFLEVGDVALAIMQQAQEGSHSYTDLASLAISLSPDQPPQETAQEFVGMIQSLQTNHLFMGSKRLT